MTEESNLVKHAKRELDILKEDAELVKATLEIISIFSTIGHSGMSAAYHVGMITQLLQYENLAPLTDDPEEWNHIAGDVWGAEGGVYQSQRNSRAFSNDGGKTYYLLDDEPGALGTRKMYTSEKRVVADAV